MTIITDSPFTIEDHAMAFFQACETGKGWDACSAYCSPDATFSAQAEPLLEIATLAQYTDWMKGILSIMPDGRYDLKAFASAPEPPRSIS